MGPSGWSRVGVARGLRGLVGVLAAALVLAVVAAGATRGAARASSSLVWSAPVLVGRGIPAVSSGGIVSLACPSVSLCVGFDDLGNLVMSTRPAAVRSWRETPLAGLARLAPAGLACPSVLLCVGLASTDRGAGRLIVSTTPGAGARAWRIERLRAVHNPYAISCPSSTLCVGVEASGNVVTSTDPTGGAEAWHAAHIDSAHTLGLKADVESVSCPTVALCVADDDAGNVFSSGDPTGGASAWTRFHVKTEGPGDSAVSCPSISLCVADVEGTLLTSTNPLGGALAWTRAHVEASSVEPALACASNSFCVAGELDGRVTSSTSPTRGRKSWRLELIDGVNPLTSVACPTTTFCVAVDSDGNVLLGTQSRIQNRVPAVIVRSERVNVTAKRHGSRLSVDSGLSIGCPSGRVSCTVNGKATTSTLSGRTILLGRIDLKIRAGKRRKIVFVLSRSGERLLIKKTFFEGVDLQTVARLSGGLAVAGDAFPAVFAPG
jgi:hypothetical protein